MTITEREFYALLKLFQLLHFSKDEVRNAMDQLELSVLVTPKA
jgi:hypothetical protein